MTTVIEPVSPADFAAHAVLADEMGQQLLEQLSYMTLMPKEILVVGCGAGVLAVELKKRYPDATLLTLESMPAMLDEAQSSIATINLPFADHSVDLVFANLVLPWCADSDGLLREWRRMLRPEGLLLFSSLGPATLTAWQSLFAANHMPHFADMHNVGDALVQARFSDPVMESDYITLTYRDANKLLRELQVTGMLRLTESHQIEQAYAVCETERNAQGVYATVYEMIFGHAWVPALSDKHFADDDGVVSIPLSQLRRQLASR